MGAGQLRAAAVPRSALQPASVRRTLVADCVVSGRRRPGVVVATILGPGSGLVVFLAGALVGGSGFGPANGILVAKNGNPPFIPTLGKLRLAQSLAVAATGGRSVVGIGDALPALY